MKDDRLYLVHILEAIEKIELFTKDGHHAFKWNIMIQDAVIRNFEIIGEATKHLSAGTREKYPQVPWRQVAGMRDVLIHDYMGVDLDEIWNVVANDLDDFKQAVQTALKELD